MTYLLIYPFAEELHHTLKHFPEFALYHAGLVVNGYKIGTLQGSLSGTYCCLKGSFS